MRKLLLVTILTFPFTAFAAGADGSQFFYQAPASVHEVTPSFHMDSVEVKFKTAGKFAEDRNILRAEYEYGLMEDIAVGATLGYVFSGENKMGATASDVTGLENIDAHVKANMPMGSGLFKYGATLSMSLGDNEIENNGDENAMTGGTSLDPYVGYEMAMDNCIVGAKLAAEIGLTDRTTVDSSSGSKVTSESSGAEDTILSLFYEHKFGDELRLGAALDWITTTDDEETVGGVTTTTEALSPQQMLRVYAPYRLGAGTLLPQLEMGFSSDDSVANQQIDSVSMMNLSVGYRLEI